MIGEENDEIVSLVKSFLQALEGEFRQAMKWPSDDEHEPNLARARVLIEVVNYRVHELGTAALTQIDANLPLASLIATRGAFEAAVVLAPAIIKAENSLRTHGDLSDPRFESFVMKALFGSRANREHSAEKVRAIVDTMLAHSDLSSDLVTQLLKGALTDVNKEAEMAQRQLQEALSGFESVNVMTLVEAASKRYPPASAHYQDLCEFAHPNSAGMLEMYTARKDDAWDTITLMPSGTPEHSAVALGNLLNTVKMFGSLREDFENVLSRASKSRIQ